MKQYNIGKTVMFILEDGTEVKGKVLDYEHFPDRIVYHVVNDSDGILYACHYRRKTALKDGNGNNNFVFIPDIRKVKKWKHYSY